MASFSKSGKGFRGPQKEKGGWFSKGQEEATKARQQAQSTFRPEFWMKSGETAKVIFLDKEPFNIYLHSFNMRGRIKKYTCLRKNCPLCKFDEPRFLSVFRIIDLRKFEGKDGKVVSQKEKYYEAGAKAQVTLARLYKKGLAFKRLIEISRDGEGTASTYQFVPIGPIGPKLKARVLKMLTPKLSFETDYAPKSLVELKDLAAFYGAGEENTDDHDDDDDKKTKTKSYLDDEDEDDDDTESEDSAESDDEDADEDPPFNVDGEDEDE